MEFASNNVEGGYRKEGREHGFVPVPNEDNDANQRARVNHADGQYISSYRSVMKTPNRTRITLSILLIILASSPLAQAFYNPASGQWLSRDPIAEDGGKNLYRFVKNSPLHHFDPLGQYPTTSFYICWPKCNGKTYNPTIECCCNGKVVSTKEIETGVVRHKWSENPNGSGMVHVWLTWDGGSADSNSDSIVTPPGSHTVSSPAGATPSPSTPTPIKLSPCEYDFKKLNTCLSRRAQERIGSDGGDCRAFAGDLLGECMTESKGCTAPP